MTIAMFSSFAAVGVFMWVLIRASEHPRPAAPIAGSSPLDEAERVLAFRYARGEISFDQYERMRVLLRH